MFDYGIPDQLGSDYGSSDAPAVKMSGSGGGGQSQFPPPSLNPYAQYSGPKAPPQIPQAGGYPTEINHGYEEQMIRGLPNNAPFAINEVSMTPYRRGMFDPVWTYAKAANIKGVEGYAGWDNWQQGWDNLWSQGVPQAPIDANSLPQQLAELGNALGYVGLMTASAKWADINAALTNLQRSVQIQETGVYDAPTQAALSKAVTAKRQGQAVGDVWKMANEQGILPSWWASTPAAAPVVPPPQEKADNTWKWVAGGVAVAAIIGIIWYQRGE
jgi:hypothetical protein